DTPGGGAQRRGRAMLVEGDAAQMASREQGPHHIARIDYAVIGVEHRCGTGRFRGDSEQALARGALLEGGPGGLISGDFDGAVGLVVDGKAGLVLELGDETRVER